MRSEKGSKNRKEEGGNQGAGGGGEGISKLRRQEEFNVQERSSHNPNLSPAYASFAMLVKSKENKTQATKSIKSEN